MSANALVERREEEKEERRQAIIEAAARVFQAKGVDEATFADIAAAARLSRTLIYFYFKDKEELIQAVTKRGEERLLARFQAVAAVPGPALYRLEGMGRAYVAFATDDAFHFRLMSRSLLQAACFKYDTNGEVTKGDPILELLAQTVVEGFADGSVRPDAGDPLQLAVCLWGMSHGMVQLKEHLSEVLKEGLGVDSTAMIYNGLRLMTSGLRAEGFSQKAV